MVGEISLATSIDLNTDNKAMRDVSTKYITYCLGNTYAIFHLRIED